MSSFFAQVAVENTVYHFDRLFTYEVPHEMAEKLKPGMRVAVPFGTGNKKRVGMVFSLDGEVSKGMKSLLSVLDETPMLSEEMLHLAKWMKERYFCTLFEAVKSMIPTGFQMRLQNSYLLSKDFKNFDRECFSDIQWRVLMVLSAAGKAVPFQRLQKEVGIVETAPEFLSLLKDEVVFQVHTAANKIKDAISKMVRPVSDFSGKLSPRQQEVYQTLLDVGEASEKELCYFTGVSSSVIKALVSKGAAEVFEYETYRRPEFFEAASPLEAEKTLSFAQQEIYEKLLLEISQDHSGGALLYGVTGSGKTAVFMKLIQHVCALGKDVIVMVPEISLTAQTILQFRRVFGDTIAVFHSGLSLGERMDEWKRAARGKAKIVIGTRSAVFAPLQNLGLVVIDEEHEHTYKSESSPRYDAREVARYRCWKNQAFCLLSSATPSVESYKAAQDGRLHFHRLNARFGEAQIPEVMLVDMNEETHVGEEALISQPLAQALRETFEAGKQSIILLNRRGYHTFVSCRVCHEVVSCPHCSISLTYHSANQRMMCHYCGFSVPFSKHCPSCGEDTVTFRGMGTQKAEDQLQELLPQAQVLRVDTDAITEKFSLQKKLDAFSQGKYQVMVGTQMVAKGLDFENVTLVGVLSADQSLFSDDFRSNERTFDLLTQVVGRAGRGKNPGKAVIQTYSPENPILYLAAKQDYFGFYDREILFRQALLYPPYVDILVVGFVGEQEKLVKNGAEFFLQTLGHVAKERYEHLPLRVLRPSPAAVAKLSNKYRYKLIIKCRNSAPLRQMVHELLCDFAKQREFQSVTAYIDTNPYMIL